MSGQVCATVRVGGSSMRTQTNGALSPRLNFLALSPPMSTCQPAKCTKAQYQPQKNDAALTASTHECRITPHMMEPGGGGSRFRGPCLILAYNNNDPTKSMFTPTNTPIQISNSCPPPSLRVTGELLGTRNDPLVDSSISSDRVLPFSPSVEMFLLLLLSPTKSGTWDNYFCSWRLSHERTRRILNPIRRILYACAGSHRHDLCEVLYSSVTSVDVCRIKPYDGPSLPNDAGRG